MKKRILSCLCLLCLMTALTLGLFIPASAARITEDLFYLSEQSNMGIRVDFDTEVPYIHFIAPNGTKFDDTAVKKGLMTKEITETSLFFMIPQAQAGQWQIVYDKGANQALDINWGPYGEMLQITRFDYQADPYSTNYLDVAFRVEHSLNAYYDFEISAVVLDENGLVLGEKLLVTGSGYTNSDYTREVSLYQLNSYHNYHLMLSVDMDDNGITVFDSQISENSFSYDNPNAPEAMDTFDVTIGVTESYLRVDWSDARYYYNYGYLLAVYEDGQTDPSYYVELERGIEVHEVTMAHKASKYRIELRYKNYDGVYSAPAVKEVDLTMKDLLTIPDWDVTNAVQIPVTYDFTRFSGSVKATVTVNGTSEEILLSGKNVQSFNLDENQNKFSLAWWPSDDLCFVVSDTINSDRHSPILNLYEFPAGGIQTDKSTFILTGSTTAGCTVTVGGQTVTVGNDGIFTITLNLAMGLNQFAVVSTSPAGNSSLQKISIERIALGISSKATGFVGILLQWLPLILTVVCSCLLLGHLLLSKRIWTTNNGPKFAAVKKIVSNSLYLLSIGCGIGLLISILKFIPAYKTINSTAFYEAAKSSVAEAYALLDVANLWKILMIVFAFGLAAFLTGAILIRKMPDDKFANRQPKPKKPKKVKPAPAPAVQAPAPASEETPVDQEPAPAVEETPIVEEPAPEIQETAEEPPVVPAPAAPRARFCPNCGKPIPENSMFCGNCGYKVPQ